MGRWRASPNAVGFLVFAMLQLALIFTHAPWADEVQARLIAEQSWPDIFHSLHYEGHPALWYVVLKGLGGILPGRLVLPIAQASISLGILALIWFRAPFALPIKLLVCLSYFVVFEYGVIARSYGLGVLLFFAFVSLRKTPWAWLMLALLVNVSLHTAILAGVCVLWLVAEGQWSSRGATLLVVSGVLFLITVWPAADVVPSHEIGADQGVQFFLGDAYAASLLVPVDVLRYPANWQWIPEPKTAMLLGLLPPFVGAAALWRRWRDVGLLWAFAAALYVLPLVVYITWPRHWGLVSILFVGLLWGQVEDGLSVGKAATGWLVLLAVGGAAFVVSALTQPFAPERQVARWIERRNLRSAPWAAFLPLSGVGLTAELGIPTYNPIKRCWQTFHRGDYKATPKYKVADFERWMNAYANDTGGGYLMSDRVAWTMGNAQPLAYFYAPIRGQYAYVYYVRPKKPAPRPIPNCR